MNEARMIFKFITGIGILIMIGGAGLKPGKLKILFFRAGYIIASFGATFYICAIM